MRACFRFGVIMKKEKIDNKMEFIHKQLGHKLNENHLIKPLQN